jgi:hypothetical protein
MCELARFNVGPQAGCPVGAPDAIHGETTSTGPRLPLSGANPGADDPSHLAPQSTTSSSPSPSATGYGFLCDCERVRSASLGAPLPRCRKTASWSELESNLAFIPARIFSVNAPETRRARSALEFCRSVQLPCEIDIQRRRRTAGGVANSVDNGHPVLGVLSGGWRTIAAMPARKKTEPDADATAAAKGNGRGARRIPGGANQGAKHVHGRARPGARAPDPS